MDEWAVKLREKRHHDESLRALRAEQAGHDEVARKAREEAARQQAVADEAAKRAQGLQNGINNIRTAKF